MAHATLQVKNVGQIKEATVEFGDLTVLVGPQATGKSIFLQLFRLLVDRGAVLSRLKHYGLDWKRELARFLDIYLGEGIRGIWHESSRLLFNKKAVDLDRLIGSQKRNKTESLFFIPAQRVLTLGRGWPRPFTDYAAGDPFAVRDFSEKTRSLMEQGLVSGEESPLFPHPKRLTKPMRDLLNETVFRGFTLQIDRHGAQRRLVLRSDESTSVGDSLPFMGWSAGQREFTPLLLGLYWLLPPTKTPRRGDLEWVVIEELEMGLHPRAISTVLLLVLHLLARGYRVCLSTHSPHVLDVVWALRVFQSHQAKTKDLLALFDLPLDTVGMGKIAQEVPKKDIRVYYFDPDSRCARDISALDPGSEDPAESGWGGLAEFSGHVADVVADVVSRSERQHDR